MVNNNFPVIFTEKCLILKLFVLQFSSKIKKEFYNSDNFQKLKNFGSAFCKNRLGGGQK